MSGARRIRFVEPRARPGRPFNAWVRHWPLLGPIALATLLDERGYDARAYSENLSGSVLDRPDLLADLCDADVVGISIMTPTASRGYKIARELRRAGARGTIVFGGVHATMLPEEALAHGDVVVRGEGETVIEPIASGEVRRGIVQASPPEDLDRLPAPDFRLLHDFDVLASPGRGRQLYELPVMTSRGCPHNCVYCSVTRMFGRGVRRQSVQKVYWNLCRYLDQGFRRFFFYDDNFTSDRSWARELLALMRPLRVNFNAQVRVDFPWIDAARTALDRPLLKAMRQGGGDVLYIGYETIDQATAARWRKGYRGGGSLERRLRQDTQVLHDHGFWIHGMFILGPEDTEDQARRTVDFARHGGLESMQMSVLTPLPGTAMMEQLRPHLLFTQYPSDWDYYDGTHCVYRHARLGIERLQRVLLEAHRRFYGWSGWSLRRVRAILEQRLPPWAKLDQLWTGARIARTILRSWRQEIAEFLEVAKARMALMAGS